MQRSIIRRIIGLLPWVGRQAAGGSPQRYGRSQPARHICGAVLVIWGCASCTPAAQPLPTPSSAPPAGIPRSVPAPTPATLEPPIDTLLRANPETQCVGSSAAACAVPWAVRLIEHLRRYPASPRRAEIIEQAARRLGYGRDGGLTWLIDSWLDQALLRPLTAAPGRIPAGLAEQWQQHGQLITTDLDGDRRPDRLVSFADQATPHRMCSCKISWSVLLPG